MRVLRNLARRVRAFVFRTRAEQELQRELAFHLDLETENNVAKGMTPTEARQRARADFGSIEATKDAYRDGRGSQLVDQFVADVRLSLRALRRNPGFTATAIITLMLGIGANVAIFSAVHAVLLRPLPFSEPDRLVMLWESNVERGWVRQTAAPANMFDWAEQVRAFDGVGAYASFTNSATLTGDGEPEQFSTIQVTGNFFGVLGVTPAIGQLFRDEETWATGELTAMITHRLWRRRFAMDSTLPGRTIELNGRPVRVTGVLPENFSLPGADVDIWRPTAFARAQEGDVGFRRGHWLRPVARLRDGVTPEQANAEMQTVVARLQREYPVTNTGMEGGLTPLHEFLTGDSRRPLLILLGAVGALLLIACANVGNLLLVQASARRHETALKLALGARGSRLVRQALTESLVLAVLGGVAGCASGYWSAQMLAPHLPTGMLPTTSVPLAWGVLAYVAGITVASSMMFGLAPILWMRRHAPGDAMREAGRGGATGRRTRKWGEYLVVSEVALALLLTMGAGLLLRSFRNLESLDAGLRTEGVLTAKISLPGVRYDSIGKVLSFWDRLSDEARGLSGVTSVGLVSQLPLTVPSWSSDFKAELWPADRFGIDVLHRDAGPGYFETMRIPLLRGRTFERGDRYGGERVVIVNAIIAEMFGDTDPVGQRIAFTRAPDTATVWYRIVGVVGSERQSALAAPARPEIFEPVAQRVNTTAIVALRTTVSPTTLIPGVRKLLAEIDPTLALAELRTMSDVRSEAAARERFMTMLLLAFALVGVSLAVVGVYGVMARVARTRSREMGIRVALGADTSEVRWLVVRRGLLLAGCGVALGLVGAVISTRALGSLLYGVDPLDPVTFAAVSVLLIGAAFAACWIPAARAGRAQPMHALRSD